MTTIYPSEALPGPSSVSVDLPATWSGTQLPRTTMVLRVDEPANDGFETNIVVSQRRVSSDMTVEILREAVKEGLGALDEFVRAYGADLEVTGHPAFLQEYAFIQRPAGVPLAQIQLNILVAVDESQVDVVTLTGSAGPVGTQAQLAQMREIIKTVKVLAPN